MGTRGSEIGQIRRGFEHACEQGDVGMAIACAKDLGGLKLDSAARLLEAMARTKHPAFGPAAVRWITRYLEESRHLKLEQLIAIVDAIAEMPTDSATAAVLLNATRYSRHTRQFVDGDADA